MTIQIVKHKKLIKYLSITLIGLVGLFGVGMGVLMVLKWIEKHQQQLSVC